MNCDDFDRTGFYNIGSIKNKEEAPDNDVGDYKVLCLNHNKNFQTMLLSSPRYNDRLYIGRFWEREFLKWDMVSLVRDLYNENFLFNSNFKMNQRRKSSYQGNQLYTVDRWMVWGGIVTVINNGVKVKASEGSNRWEFKQLLEYNREIFNGKYFSISVKINGQIYTVTFKLSDNLGISWGYEKNLLDNVYVRIFTSTEGIFTFLIYNNTTDEYTINWAKMEMGENPTPYIEPDPQIEYQRCTKYFQTLHGYWKSISAGFIEPVADKKLVRFPIILNSKMRVTPTVTIDNLSNIQAVGGNVAVAVEELDSFTSTGEEYYQISFKIPDSITPITYRDFVELYFGNAVFLYFDAEIHI